MDDVWGSYMPAIGERDSVTGLEVFMLASCGDGGGVGKGDLECVWRLLREYPIAIGTGWNRKEDVVPMLEEEV